MKKLLTFLLSVAASAALIASAPVFEYSSFAAQESAATEIAEDSADEEENGSSRTAVVLTVIVVFTITTAVTSVFTYRIRRKSFIGDLRSDSKQSGEDSDNI